MNSYCNKTYCVHEPVVVVREAMRGRFKGGQVKTSVKRNSRREKREMGKDVTWTKGRWGRELYREYKRAKNRRERKIKITFRDKIYPRQKSRRHRDEEKLLRVPSFRLRREESRRKIVVRPFLPAITPSFDVLLGDARRSA